jgi:predicted nucleic acid-binding protein
VRIASRRAGAPWLLGHVASGLIAHLDADDALQARATGALLRHADDDLRLPASAYAESLVSPARRGRLETAREVVSSLALTIVPIDEEVAVAAAGLRSRRQSLRLPDALVLACADVLDADVVLTTDRRWARLPRVVVIR